MTEKRTAGHPSTAPMVMVSSAAERREVEEPISLVTEQFASLFREHADFVRRSLRRVGLPPADIDDALQEVFLVVLRRIAEYEDRGLLRAWLFAISRQVASHYHRGRTRAENRRRALMVVDTTSPDLEEILLRREAEVTVSRFLNELDEPQRVVFYLSDIEGLTAPEIAVALSVNINTIYGRLRLARKRFEKFIAASGKGETRK